MDSRSELCPEGPVQWSMQVADQLDSATIQRVRKQGEFLLRIYQAEFAKGPTSSTTESSRSNFIALQHTVSQLYGEAVAWDLDIEEARW